jgi:NAD-dependent DNA ligase
MRRSMSNYVRNVEADDKGAFYDADVVFTGAMVSMPRDAAMQMVAERGGRPRTSVSQLTEYVVLGQIDHEAFTQGSPSRKLKAALDLVEAGHSIQVLSEKEFLELL